MLKIRQADKRKRYRAKGYARLRKSYAKMERLGVKNCEICGTAEYLTIDHKIPVSKGGKNNIENLQVLCNDCNQFKADLITPSTA
jgi:5-methylcytosine-specific restriction endonuclease McrA